MAKPDARRTSIGVLIVAIFLCLAVPAQAASPWPQTPLSGRQLAASSKAATTFGVPVGIVRQATTARFGRRATTADFTAQARRLARSYKQLHRHGGSAALVWARVAATAEPKPNVTTTTVVTSTGAPGDQGTTTTLLVVSALVAAFALGLALGLAIPRDGGDGGDRGAPNPIIDWPSFDEARARWSPAPANTQPKGK